MGEFDVGHAALAEFTRGVFARAGLEDDAARCVAEVLVWANLRGIDSHGVLRIPSYLRCLDAGHMNARPEIRVIRQSGAAAVIDADLAVGPVGMRAGMRRALALARESAVGWVWISRSTHCGAVGYYALMAAEENMAGLVLNATRPLMAAHGSRASTLGTSPIAIALPAATGAPLVLDMATSAIAMGKVMRARAAGELLPENTVLDETGQPTVDPARAHTLLPIAGPKGSGLALMIECLASAVTGEPLLTAEVIGESERTWDMRQNAVVVAVDLSRFTDLGAFGQTIRRLLDTLKAEPRAEGFDEVLAPGERSGRTERARREHGIPIPAATWSTLGEIAERFGLVLPDRG